MDRNDAVSARRAAEMSIDGYLHDDDSPRFFADVALIPLMSRAGKVSAWTAVDADDYDLVADPRWCRVASGYAVARIGGRYVYMHRLIIPGAGLGDHISGDKLDNRRRNLRLTDCFGNARNSSGSKSSVTGLKGVTIERDWFCAQIMVNYQRIALGRFRTAVAAAHAYDRAARAHFGEFARPNFPGPDDR